MFERRIIPVYLTLSALTLAVWSAAAPGTAPRTTFGLALAAMVALYAVAVLIDRGRRMWATVPQGLDAAAKVNAARIAPPLTVDRYGDPRR